MNSKKLFDAVTRTAVARKAVLGVAGLAFAGGAVAGPAASAVAAPAAAPAVTAQAVVQQDKSGNCSFGVIRRLRPMLAGLPGFLRVWAGLRESVKIGRRSGYGGA